MKKVLILICLLSAGVMAAAHYAGFINVEKFFNRDKDFTVKPRRNDVLLEVAQKRVALVIGNANYKYANELPNDLNDAEDMEKALSKFGFEVKFVTDADYDKLIEALSDFGAALADGGVGLFYYSGHGVELGGKQYIVPVDAKLKTMDYVDREAISVTKILDKMGSSKSKLNFVILDACRNNPFYKSWGIKGAVNGGFSEAKMPNPSGILIASATAAGDVSSAAGERNSVYTKYLLHYLDKNPDLEVALLLRRVRAAVEDATNSNQVPWETGAIKGEFYFLPPQQIVAVTPVPVPPAPKKEEPAPAAAPVAETEPATTETRQSFEPEMVKLATGIGMGKYEVTIEEYMQCVNDNGCNNPVWLEEGNQYNINTGSSKGYYAKYGMSLTNKLYPITGVSWDDTQKYIAWLNNKTGKTYCLPSEEEWFAACQAGKSTEYSGSDKAEDVAWYSENSGDTAHAVGQKTKNSWDLHDMSGNVWEWTKSQEAERRVLRGGAFDNYVSNVSCAARLDITPDSSIYFIGFRVALCPHTSER